MRGADEVRRKVVKLALEETELSPRELAVTFPRVSDLLCMSNLAHASKLKEHDDNDDIQGSIRRAAERR